MSFQRYLMTAMLGLSVAACGESFNTGPSTSCTNFGLCLTSTNYASGSYDYRPTAGQYWNGRLVGITAALIPQNVYQDPSTNWRYIGWELDQPDGAFAGRTVYRQWVSGPSKGQTEVAHVSGTAFLVDSRYAYSRQAR